MVKRNLLKFGVIITAMTILSGCGKKNNTTSLTDTEETKSIISKETESTTATDILAVTITDKNGNSHVIEGVGITDKDGNTTITVTDDKGNETVIVGKVETDSEGKKTVTDATVITGGEITTSKGDVIDTTDATVGNIEDNNSGDIETDVSVSEDKKQEVESKKEEATSQSKTEAVTQTQATQVQTSAPTEKATSAPTVKPNATESQTETKAVTEKATTAPTSTESQTKAETPTTKPLTKEEQIISDCKYTDKGSYVKITDYEGTESNLVIPSYIDGKPVTYVGIGNNENVKTLTIPDTVTQCCINACDTLEVVNFGKGMTEIKYQTLPYCTGIKEINMYGKVTLIEKEWVSGDTITDEHFSGAVLNIHNNPENVILDDGLFAFPASIDIQHGTILDRFNDKDGGLADSNSTMFKEVNFIY